MIDSPSQSGFTVRRNFAWMTVANVIYAASMWSIIIALTRLGSPEIAGIFAFGLAVTSPIMQLATLQVRTLQSTEKARGFGFGDFLVVRTGATLLALIVIAAVARFAGFEGIKPEIVMLVGLCKAIEHLDELAYGHFQQSERLDKVALSMMVRGPLAALAVGVTMWSTDSLPLAVTAMGCSWLVVLLCLDVPRLAADLTRERRPLRPRHDYIKVILRSGVLLGIVVGINSLLTSIPTYLIDAFLSDYELGVFAGIAVLVRIGFFVETALSQSAIPRLSRLHDANDRHGFSGLLVKLLLFAAALGLVQLGLAALLGRWVLTLIYAPSYAEFVPVLLLLMAASTVGYGVGFLKAACNASKAYAQQIPIFAVAVLASISVGIPLVSEYSLLGAAATIIIARIVVMCGYAYFAARSIRQMEA